MTLKHLSEHFLSLKMCNLFLINQKNSGADMYQGIKVMLSSFRSLGREEAVLVTPLYFPLVVEGIYIHKQAMTRLDYTFELSFAQPLTSSLLAEPDFSSLLHPFMSHSLYFQLLISLTKGVKLFCCIMSVVGLIC